MKADMKQAITLATGYALLYIPATHYLKGYGWLLTIGLFLVNLGNTKAGE